MQSTTTYQFQGSLGAYSCLKFHSVAHFHDWVASEITNLKAHHRGVLRHIHTKCQSRINKGSTWYGTPIVQSLADLEEHDQFIGKHLIAEVTSEIKGHLGQYLNLLRQELTQTTKRTYNDKGIGLFDFDRAATGLHYTNHIDCSTPLTTFASQLRLALGHQKLTTSVKKVFVAPQIVKGYQPALRIYLKAGGNQTVAGDELLYVGLACQQLVQFLQALGVPVEVNVLIGTYSMERHCFAIVPVKRFDNHLNTNELLLLSSCPRYFRYRGFKALVALTNHFNIDIEYALGRCINGQAAQIAEQLHDQRDSKAYAFENSYSLHEAIEEVKRVAHQNYSSTSTI